MKHEVTVSSSRHTIETPLEDLDVGDVVEIFDKDGKNDKETVIAINSNACDECPLFSGRNCQYHWEDENGILHALCESKAFINNPNADDIRLRSLDDILEHIGG